MGASAYNDSIKALTCPSMPNYYELPPYVCRTCPPPPPSLSSTTPPNRSDNPLLIPSTPRSLTPSNFSLVQSLAH